MSSLKAYLAANYMSGPKADAILARSSDPTVKKRRKKVRNEDYIGSSSGTRHGHEGANGSSRGMVVDEDDHVLGDDEELEEEDAPTLGKDIATFQKGKSTWSTVGATALPMPSAVKSEPVDRAELELSSSIEPTSSSTTAPPAPPKRRGGLRKAADLAAEADERDRLAAAARAERASLSPTAEKQGPTVHRDASGRVVDIQQLREQARREAEEEKRKELEKKEWNKGLVQRGNRADQAREVAEMASRDVARYADDVKMNEELKQMERWNDPAANFTTATHQKKRGPKWPQYKGSFPPNRFQIAPGYRWDGVDRSNGFEKKYFAYQNAAARRKYEGDQMDMEDL